MKFDGRSDWSLPLIYWMFENHGEIINMRSALCQTVSPSGQYENDSPSLPTVIFLKNFD